MGEEKDLKIERLTIDVDNINRTIENLAKKVEAMAKMIHMLRGDSETPEKVKAVTDKVFNKDGIPLNTVYLGYTRKHNTPVLLTVEADGSYKVGTTTYQSLSAAAEAVSGIRRSGWTFWKTKEGKTLKEVFK